MLYRLIKRLSVYNFACALTKRAQRSFFSPRPPRNPPRPQRFTFHRKEHSPATQPCSTAFSAPARKTTSTAVVVEIGDGQHLIHTCQRFQRTTAAIYQQRADLKRWGWWGGSVWYTCPQRMALCCVTDCGRQCSTVGGGYVHFCQSLSMPCTVINKKSRHFLQSNFSYSSPIFLIFA